VARLLVAFALLAAFAAPAGAQVELGRAPADTSLIGVRLPSGRAYLLTAPPAFTAPWLAGPRYLPSLANARWEQALGASADSARAVGTRNLLFLQLYGVATEAQDSTEAALAQKGVFGISRKVVDLNLDGWIWDRYVDGPLGMALMSITGFFMLFVTLHMHNGLAWLWKKLAEILLGGSIESAPAMMPAAPAVA